MTSLSKRRVQALALGLLLALQASRVCSDSGPLDALRSEVLALDQASKALLAPAYTGPDGFTVYVGSNAKSVWLREIWLGIDNKPLTRYVYSQQEAEALAARGLHQLLAADLAPGRHRLRAQAAAAPLDAGPSDPRQRAAIDLEFEKLAGPVQFELSWTEASFAGQPTLKLREWSGSPARSSAIQNGGPASLAGADDPGARAADFLDATGHRFMAGALRQQLGIRGLAPAAPTPEVAMPGAAADNSAALYAAYNALVGEGAAGDRLAALETLANGEECKKNPRLLCDRLNAALGYQRLAGRDGLAAAAAFRRVRDPGPYANSALLGLGWALLAPQSADAAANKETVTAGPRQREVRPMPPKELAEVLRAAMVPWIELTGRDPTDPAVQEGQIALPWALSQLDAQVQAQDYYNRAVAQLDAIVLRADKAAAEVSGGKLRATVLGLEAGEAWHWGLADLLPDSRWWLYPPEPVRETFYLEPLLGDKPFRDAATQLQELQEMDATLAANERALSALGDTEFFARTQQLRARIATLRDADCRQLEVRAADSLQGLKRQTQAYLVEARYALAQLYDRAPELASP
jgi:hypothetical protein